MNDARARSAAGRKAFRFGLADALLCLLLLGSTGTVALLCAAWARSEWSGDAVRREVVSVDGGKLVITEWALAYCGGRFIVERMQSTYANPNVLPERDAYVKRGAKTTVSAGAWRRPHLTTGTGGGWAVLGVEYEPLAWPNHRSRALGFPIWMAVLPAASVGCVSCALAWRRRARRRRAADNECERCGYDLRASPDQCPECGQWVRRPS